MAAKIGGAHASVGARAGPGEPGSLYFPCSSDALANGCGVFSLVMFHESVVGNAWYFDMEVDPIEQWTRDACAVASDLR